MSPAHHQLDHSADPAQLADCNLGRHSLATLGLASRAGFARCRRSSRQAISIFAGLRDTGMTPHGLMGLVVDPALNALNALIGAVASRRTTAGSEPPSVGRSGLPAADFKI